MSFRLVLRLPRITALFPAATGQGIALSVAMHLSLLGGTILAASLGDGTPERPRIYTVSIVTDTTERRGGGPAPAAAAPTEPPEKPAREVRPDPEPQPARRTPPRSEPPPKPSRSAPKPRPPVERPPNPPDDAAPSGEGGSGSGLVGGDPAPGGSVPSIDSEAFPFAYYRRALNTRLRGAWSRPLVPGGLAVPIRTTVRFEILRGGAITGVETVTGSGYAPLDRSALRAVYDVNPLPPLPEEFEGNRLAVNFYFELTPGS